MGTQPSTLSSPSLTPLSTISLPHLGHLTLLQKDDNYCLLKKYSYSDQFLMEDRYRKLKTRTNKFKNNLHVMEVYQVVKKEKKQICANNFQIFCYLEQYQETLKEQIDKRLAQKRNYTQEELFVFMSKTVDSLIFLQDNGLKNIHLDSYSIVFCKNSNSIKILDSTLAHSSSYSSLLQSQQAPQNPLTPFYLAPQLLKQIQNQNYDPYISPKADIFSLGMIILQMIALQSMQGYYDYQRYNIDYDSLIHRLSKINHSLEMKTILAQMLQYDQEERIGLVSLKEKIGKIVNKANQSQGITRSRSSKMLKEMLSQSRRSGSIRNSEQSGSLTRQASSEKKLRPKIAVRCSAKKYLECNNTSLDPGVTPLSTRPQSKNIEQEMNSSGSNHLKNLVKNKLAKNKDKQNHLRFFKPIKKDIPILPEPKQVAHVRNVFQESQGFNSSMRSHKFDESARSGKQNTLGPRSTLNKLVEESGIKKLLKVEHLEEISLKKNASSSNLESQKNTSRFGRNQFESTSHLKKSKLSDVYVEDQSQEHTQELQQHQPRQDSQVKTPQAERTLNKVMTFNKNLIDNARSIQNTVQYPTPSSHIISPKNTQIPSSSYHKQSSQRPIIIKDVPVVISQQKNSYQPKIGGNTTPSHFGRLQRQLNLMECIQSIHQEESINSSFGNNVSNVIQSYCPKEEDYSSVEDMYKYQPFKKARAKKPKLVIELDNSQEKSINQKNKQFQSKKRQSTFKPSAEHYKQAFQADHISNFTSISPPQDAKDSINEDIFYMNSSPIRDEEGITKIKLSNGDQYEGEIIDGLPHGNGVLYRDGKMIYSGSFRQGKYAGYGTLLQVDYQEEEVDYRSIEMGRRYWKRFEGEFLNGLMNGFGTIFFSQHEKFAGCLKNGKIEGYGCFYRKNGELISGLWSQNKFRKV